MARRGGYRVGEAARLSGVTVRTLHYYDSIGLLVPGGRTAAGYRLYDEDDLLRLQQILIGRELGLSLEEIRRSLDDPAFDRRGALLEQRAALIASRGRADRMIRAVDAALALITDGRSGDNDMKVKDIFDGFEPEQYAGEAKARWGHTDSYRMSAQRTQAYGDTEWAAIREEQSRIYADASAALKAGKSADDPEVLEIADRHRRLIDRWFYPCSVEMHVGLAGLYESDPRFAASIDKHGAGLTGFLVAAIRANASRRR